MSGPPAEVLAAYELDGAALAPITMGNINRSYAVRSGQARYVLQSLNPIFGPEVHDDIQVVTTHLQRKGLATPTLVPTRAGASWLRDDAGEVWRLFTHVAGVVHNQGASPALCASAGELLARFHQALLDLDYTFKSTRVGVHDTARHLATLRQALATHTTHRAFIQVEPVGLAILKMAAALPRLGELPLRVVHGDPKLNNMIFSPAGAAVCLIDLDTLGRLPIPVEMGDAFRSWCNPSGEDDTAPEFELACFKAGITGYARAAQFLTVAEVRAIPLAIETITLELAARFCADALVEKYFGWNRERYASATEHHLVRAQGQLRLAQSYARQRESAARVVEQAFARG